MSTHICERCQAAFEYNGNVKRCPSCRTTCKQCGAPTEYQRLCERCRHHVRKSSRLVRCKATGCTNLIRKAISRSGLCRLHYDKTDHALRIAQYNKTVKAKPKHLHYRHQNDYVLDLICKVCNKPFKGRLGTVKYRAPQDGYCCSPRCVGIIAAKKTPKQRTSIEQAIAQALDLRHIAYLQQVPLCGITLADFYLPEHNIVLYCDGTYWHREPKRQAQDAEQVRVLEANGYTVYRFTEPAIHRSPDACLDRLDLLAEPPFRQLSFPIV